MKYRPIHDMVILQPEPRSLRTAGGLHIPITADNRTHKGTVLAVGPGRVSDNGYRIEPEIKRGDVVLYLENNISQRLDRDAKDGDPIILPEVEIIAVVDQS